MEVKASTENRRPMVYRDTVALIEDMLLEGLLGGEIVGNPNLQTKKLEIRAPAETKGELNRMRRKRFGKDCLQNEYREDSKRGSGV